MLLSLAEAFASGFRPLPDVTVSQWADTYRQVSKPSPEPGQWRTDRVPYMREIMDRMSPSDPTQFVVNMKAAQGAGTEGMLNATACLMHLYPRDMMYLLPTIKMGQKFKHKRFDRMVSVTPVLRALVPDARSRDASNTSVLVEYGDAKDNLIFAGANSWADLQSDPIPVLLCDEVDSYKLELPGMGSPLYSAIQRTAGQPGRKVWINGTPTRAGGAIDTWFRAGDQNEYFVPCPLCGHMQELVWGADRWKQKAPGGIRWTWGDPQSAKYECEHCGDQFEEWQKTQILGRGEFRPAAPGNGASEFIRSYHVGSLIYPYGWPGNKWGNLAAEWERGHDKPLQRMMFRNLKEGRPWADPTEAVTDAKTLLARCETYGPELPAGVAVLAATADVQGDRIEVEVLGWGAGEENWSIDYRVLRGDTAIADGQAWQALDDLFGSTYLSETGITLGIRAGCVDAGFHQDLVRRWCHARKQRNIWPVIGRDGQGRPSWPLKAMKAKPGRPDPAWVIGVDGLKETVYARLRVLEGPGCCHFQTGTTLDRFEMLTAEVRVPDYSQPIPTFHWKKKQEGARNEWLDIRAYHHACLRGLEILTSFRLDREVEKMRALAAAKASGKPAPAGGLKFAMPKPVDFEERA